LNARNEMGKVVIVGESYDPGVWERSPQPLVANGVLGGALDAETIFTVFFQKISIFKRTLI